MGCCDHCNEHLMSVNDGEFPNQLRDCYVSQNELCSMKLVINVLGGLEGGEGNSCIRRVQIRLWNNVACFERKAKEIM